MSLTLDEIGSFLIWCRENGFAPVQIGDVVVQDLRIRVPGTRAPDDEDDAADLEEVLAKEYGLPPKPGAVDGEE